MCEHNDVVRNCRRSGLCPGEYDRHVALGMADTHSRVTRKQHNIFMQCLACTCSSVSWLTEAGPGADVGDATVEKARAAATAMACRMNAWLRVREWIIPTIDALLQRLSTRSATQFSDLNTMQSLPSAETFPAVARRGGDRRHNLRASVARIIIWHTSVSSHQST